MKLCIKNKDFCIKHDEFSEADGSHLLLAQRLAESCVSQNDGFSFQKTRNCALKKMIFVFKMMNFSGETGAHDSEWSVFNGRILISFISESWFPVQGSWFSIEKCWFYNIYRLGAGYCLAERQTVAARRFRSMVSQTDEKFESKVRNSVSKTRNSGLQMMNFAGLCQMNLTSTNIGRRRKMRRRWWIFD